MKKRNYMLAASLICADMLNLKRELKALTKAKVDYIHFDVMDGTFVPRFGLHPEILSQVKSVTSIPVDVHLMIQNPERFIDIFAKSGAKIIVVHAEATAHLHRAIRLIKDFGLQSGVALNPATPLTALDYILDEIDLVLLMGINPGIVGHKLIPSTIRKIKDLKKIVGDRNLHIEIDGGVNSDSAPQMIAAGANLLVCGTSTIFKPPQSIESLTRALRSKIENV